MRSVLMIGLLLLASCSSTGTMNEIMGGWDGVNIEDVVKQWGYPTEQQTFRGRQLYIWTKNDIVSTPGFTTSTTNANAQARAVPGAVVASGNQTTTGAVIGGGAMSYSCRRVLEVDDAGIVRKTSWDGNGCCTVAIGGMCKQWLNPAKPL